MSKSELREPQAYTAQEHAVELAEESLCTAERFGGWLQSADDVRAQSAYWGPIGNLELVKIALMANQSPLSGFAAIRTLRRRFLADHAEEIAQIVAGMMEEVNHG